MTEFDREEDAFRAAFAKHADDAPTEIHPRRPRPRWVAPLLSAAVVLAAVGGTFAVLHDAERAPTRPAEQGGSYWDQHDWRWIGIRDIEVKAPAGWAPEIEIGRPDCIRVGTDATVGEKDIPPQLTDPYVVIGDPNQVVTSQGCFQDKGPDDPPDEFGELPFPLWQPYVKVEAARPDLATQRREYRDTKQTFRGWNLTRETAHGVQISVLSAPGDEDLGAAVLDSLRQVSVNAIGCPARSNVLNMSTHTDLDSPPLPAPSDVAAVAICDYVRDGGTGWLRGSRRLLAGDARTLVRDILASPNGGGPNAPPDTCLYGRPKDRAIILRAVSNPGEGAGAVSEAYVFFDSCEGNGILEPGGVHKLTRTTCAPLFTAPPIVFDAGDGTIFPLCHVQRSN